MEKLVQFPNKTGAKTKKSRPRNTDGPKYFTAQQIKALRRTARDAAALAQDKGRVTGIRDWMVIDLLTSTGLRVSEAADLRCGDVMAGYGESAIWIRSGKGSVSGTVIIPEGLKRHLKWYINWKEDRNEPTGPDDHIFIGQRGPMTAQALQQIVKKFLKRLGLYQRGKSTHALRHSYAVELYSRERDLRAVQKQLRHVSIQSTLVYADVTKEKIADQVKNLWGGNS
ncbi:tyrosine-type recombinase/integrase [Desulfatitalea tepidiphila]|uniref:tyrosine-type recombinase/integrase n=1 Tax=Desulfatitalea tepidiphila TaxID=1185843 RepID=UPI0006B47C57|nr:tyrosine-type recombinase/integrase [Desulfatitalea tepidiphila]